MIQLCWYEEITRYARELRWGGQQTNKSLSLRDTFSISIKLSKVNLIAFGLLAALVIPNGETNKQIKAYHYVILFSSQ